MEILCVSCDNFYRMNRLLNQLFSKQNLMNYIADMIEKLNRINSVFIVSFYSILLDSDNKEII